MVDGGQVQEVGISHVGRYKPTCELCVKLHAHPVGSLPTWPDLQNLNVAIQPGNPQLCGEVSHAGKVVL